MLAFAKKTNLIVFDVIGGEVFVVLKVWNYGQNELQAISDCQWRDLFCDLPSSLFLSHQPRLHRFFQ